MSMAALKIGIAGYMGSGKTTCSRLFANTGARVINADNEAKLMESEPEVLQKLVREFGESILNHGKLSFSSLGSIVFSSFELLQRLNSVVHPPLLKRLQKLMLSDPDETIVVVDAALIPLWNIDDWFDLRIWVDAPRQVRLQRISARVPDIKKEQLQYRMSMQEKLFSPPSQSTWKYISNDGSVEMFNRKVFLLMEGLRMPLC